MRIYPVTGLAGALLLSLHPAHADPQLRFAEHAGMAVDGALLRKVPLPDDGERCVDLCREEHGCLATRLDGDQCLLFSSVTGEREDPNGLASSWVGSLVEMSELRRDRMGELNVLHGDYSYRADSQWLSLPDADGMPEDVLPGAIAALGEGNYALAESRLAAAFSLGQDNSAIWRLGASKLVAKLAMDPPEERVAAAGLREFAIAGATNAYLTAIDAFERVRALDTLGDALAEAGDFIGAAAVGRYRLSLQPDGAVQGSVEHWEGEAAGNAPAPEDEAAKSGEFGVWKVACDNGNSCVASAFAEGEHEGRLRIDYYRDAGPAGAPHIVIMAQPFDEDGQLGLPHESLFFDGARAAGEVAAALEPLSWHYSPGLFTLTVPATRTPDIIGLVAGSDEMVLRVSAGEPVLGAMPLAGLTEAIDYIDAVQGRIGTETAVSAPGDQPAKTVPQPPKLPVVDAEPVDSGAIDDKPPIPVIDAWEAACDEHEFVVEQGRLAGQGFALDDLRSIWLIPCSSGAYNFGSMAFLFADRKATQLMFERPDGQFAVADDPEVWLPDVQRGVDAVLMAEPEGDAASGPKPFVLRSINRGRGMGDCGIVSRHVWDGTGFRLYDQSRMDWCRGWRDFWPMTWRASAFPDRAGESAGEAGAQ